MRNGNNFVKQSVNMHNVTYELSPSRYLQYWLLAIHSVVFISLILLPMAWPIKSILLACVLLFFYQNWRGHIRTSTAKQIKSFIRHKNDWCLITQAGQNLTAELISHQRVANLLIVLQFKITDTQKNKYIYVFADSLTQDDFRRLCILLCHSVPRCDS